MLKKFRTKIFNILIKTMDIFNYLIPALGVEYYEKNVNYVELGMVTCSFDDLKQFYLDTYEDLADLILIPIGLDNIYERNDFEFLDPSININNKSFSELKKEKYKSKKFNFRKSTEYFMQKANIRVNNKLRNAIGHNDYIYNCISQEITYIPDSSKPNKVENIYLLEFAEECIGMIKSVIYIEELVYQLEKNSCIFDGDIPIVMPNDFIKKQGRNEKCLCGSSKKHKKCCGKIFN